MERLVALAFVITIVCLCHVSPETVGAVIAEDGQIGIGAITGGQFGAGSFSIGVPGSPSPAQIPEYYNEINGNGGHLVLPNPVNNEDQRENSRPSQRGSASEPNKSGGGKDGNRGNTQLYPANPQRPQANPVKTKRAQVKSGQSGKGGQGGSGGGQIVIGTVIIPNNKTNKKKHGNNKQSSDALETIFTSNSGNNGFPSLENDFDSNGGQRDNIHIGSITGGNFDQGTIGTNNNKRPTGVNGANKGSAVNNGKPNAADEALYTIGHVANSNGGANAGDGYVTGQINSGSDYNSGSNEKEEPWIWGIS